MQGMTADCVRFEVQGRAQALVGQASPHLKVAIPAVARRLGLEPGRLRQLYYGLAKRIDAWEADRIRALHEQMAAIRRQQAEIDRRMAELMGGPDGLDCTRHDVVARQACQVAPGPVERLASPDAPV